MNHPVVGQSTHTEPQSHTAHPVNPSQPSDEISLIDLILVLWKGRYIIAACTAVATIIGIIYALTAPEVFTTSTHFITKTGKNSSTGNLGQLASLAGISMPSGGNIDPSDYLDKVIQDQKFLSTLFERKWHYKGDSLPLETILQIKSDTTSPNWQYRYHMAKIDAVRKGKLLSLNKDAKSGILTLTANMPTAQLAYDINRFTLDFISNYIRNSLQTQAKEKRQFIEERMTETKEELTANENALVRFSERNLMSSSPQVMLEQGRLSRNVTMSQEIFLQFKKQYELARIEELDDQTLVQVVKSPEVAVARSKPKRSMIVIVNTLIGFLIGIFISFLLGKTTFLLKILFKNKKVF